MTIPLIIHQIWWQGHDNLSNIHKKYRKTWISAHRKWRLILWDKLKFEKLLNRIDNNYYRELYNELPFMIQKIDMAKYIILFYYGGVYADIDTICEKPLDSLLNKYKYNLIVSKVKIYDIIDFKLINNGLILCSKNNLFFNYLILEIVKNKKKKFYYTEDYYIINSTGPIAFSKAILNYVNNNNNNVKILEDNYLESSKLSNLNKYKDKGVYVTHIHNSSWTSKNFKRHFKIINFFESNKQLLKIVMITLFISFYIIFINYVY